MASPDDVEAQFYEALREADIDKLMALWADDDEVFCVHPGGPRVVGQQAIRVAFEAVFASQRPHPRPARAGAPGALASTARCTTWSSGWSCTTAEGVRTGFVVATNVYLKTAQGWRMVAHHASPGTAQETPEISEAPSVLH